MICKLKKNGGFGFRSFGRFNIALLAKQGWRLIKNLNSLLAQVLKAKYYSHTDFLSSNLNHDSSYTWKSIWLAKKVLKEGLCWRVGKGDNISIINHSWIPCSFDSKLVAPINNFHLQLVADLIHLEPRLWRKKIIIDVFSVVDTERIYNA